MKSWGISSGLQKRHREVQREKQREHGKDAGNNVIELRIVGPQVLVRQSILQGCQMHYEANKEQHVMEVRTIV